MQNNENINNIRGSQLSPTNFEDLLNPRSNEESIQTTYLDRVRCYEDLMREPEITSFRPTSEDKDEAVIEYLQKVYDAAHEYTELVQDFRRHDSSAPEIEGMYLRAQDGIIRAYLDTGSWQSAEMLFLLMRIGDSQFFKDYCPDSYKRDYLLFNFFKNNPSLLHGWGSLHKSTSTLYFETEGGALNSYDWDPSDPSQTDQCRLVPLRFDSGSRWENFWSQVDYFDTQTRDLMPLDVSQLFSLDNPSYYELFMNYRVLNHVLLWRPQGPLPSIPLNPVNTVFQTAERESHFLFETNKDTSYGYLNFFDKKENKNFLPSLTKDEFLDFFKNRSFVRFNNWNVHDALKELDKEHAACEPDLLGFAESSVNSSSTTVKDDVEHNARVNSPSVIHKSDSYEKIEKDVSPLGLIYNNSFQTNCNINWKVEVFPLLEVAKEENLFPIYEGISISCVIFFLRMVFQCYTLRQFSISYWKWHLWWEQFKSKFK